MVYDRVGKRYRRLDYQEAVPAPTGSLVAVIGRTAAGVGERTGLLDLRTGAVRWLRLAGIQLGPMEWSPDGSTLLLSVSDKDRGDFGFMLVNTRTGTTRTVWIPHQRYDTNRPWFTWYPDGRQVVVAIAYRTGAGEADPDMADHLLLRSVDTGDGINLCRVDLNGRRKVVRNVPSPKPPRKASLVLYRRDR